MVTLLPEPPNKILYPHPRKKQIQIHKKRFVENWEFMNYNPEQRNICWTKNN